jgi:hypothetical protein
MLAGGMSPVWRSRSHEHRGVAKTAVIGMSSAVVIGMSSMWPARRP